MQKTSRHATFSLSLPYEINNKKKGERHEYNHIGINTKRTDSGNPGHQECKGEMELTAEGPMARTEA